MSEDARDSPDSNALEFGYQDVRGIYLRKQNQQSSRAIHMQSLAPDQLVRLSYPELIDLSFQPYLAWIDTSLTAELKEFGLPVAYAGYSEWECQDSAPKLSISWNWFKEAFSGKVLIAPGGISCNIMLRTPRGYDLGPDMTQQLLLVWISRQGLECKLPEGLMFDRES
ncbi:DUF4902 domain-containing protein [Pseudomonas asplenii]|uniref:DUF4902 domain-containing protein n=1 Tax=Pseudomonas asplenii TaxID=53407 RepID=UPI0037C65599